MDDNVTPDRLFLVREFMIQEQLKQLEYANKRRHIRNLESPRTSNRFGCVMVSVLALIAIYRGFEPRSGKTKDYDMVCVASVLSTQYYNMKIQRSVLV
jgi:hypothetical protein